MNIYSKWLKNLFLLPNDNKSLSSEKTVASTPKPRISGDDLSSQSQSGKNLFSNSTLGSRRNSSQDSDLQNVDCGDDDAFSKSTNISSERDILIDKISHVTRLIQSCIENIDQLFQDIHESKNKHLYQAELNDLETKYSQIKQQYEKPSLSTKNLGVNYNRVLENMRNLHSEISKLERAITISDCKDQLEANLNLVASYDQRIAEIEGLKENKSEKTSQRLNVLLKSLRREYHDMKFLKNSNQSNNINHLSKLIYQSSQLAEKFNNVLQKLKN